MLSGNGRHRRPRQVPALVVTAGVTGSALAMPLLAATSATAADTATWDKVAECESGGSWSANFGSGAYGGLQFTQQQWQDAGGLDFAERADLASRSQQIAVAERVLAAQGPQAWPLCAASAGLDQQGPAAVVDPGLPGSTGAVGPAPSRPDDTVPSTTGGKPATDFGLSTAETPSPSGSPFLIPDAPSVGLPVMPAPDVPTTPPADPGTPDVPADPTAPPATPGDPTAPTLPADPTAPTTPPVSPSPADPANPATPATPAAPGATPAEGNGKHRGAPSPEEGVPSDAASAPVYTVQEGDSLAAIADAKGVKGGWSGLYAANEQVIGNDANLIKPGQNLDLTAQ
ncbi:transglycosylase family protein [Streptomyces sp. PCS3-D2]|uniref:LysM peptidoglycan-binding domain-containing protein n=1 Tax=Streptomyces sp. PCS3-D2 TaxID=1460244 RepID=UPI00044EEDA9|nr:transglycosylase family protein [Streptomyces sp. PCS3-D2]WKV73623.1 transglycosylase family protein [Streptomyces sp. PCS3-D2]